MELLIIAGLYLVLAVVVGTAVRHIGADPTDTAAAAAFWPCTVGVLLVVLVGWLLFKVCDKADDLVWTLQKRWQQWRN